MGKKDRRAPRTAVVTLRDLPGTRVMFWLVQDCPYCGASHLHPAGNLRTADPAETLGERPAPCDPARLYVLSLPPRPQKKRGKEARRRERRAGRTNDWDE
ncbi:hypothetical protein [Deinococcus navajonensis]|uniref:Uncharacterized protein n=1 Tax=Deinococcus navajonensis TaxID=309884 RepID=A0ABV8XR21_9DEIO